MNPLTHQNFQSFEENLQDGVDLFRKCTPAFLNMGLLQRINTTREDLWNSLRIYPQHFDRVYYIYQNEAIFAYTLQLLGRIEVEGKIAYVLLTLDRIPEGKFVMGRIIFTPNKFVFYNSFLELTLCVNRPLGDNLDDEYDHDLNAYLFPYDRPEIPDLTHLCCLSLYKYKFPNVELKTPFRDNEAEVHFPILKKCIEYFSHNLPPILSNYITNFFITESLHNVVVNLRCMPYYILPSPFEASTSSSY